MAKHAYQTVSDNTEVLMNVHADPHRGADLRPNARTIAMIARAWTPVDEDLTGIDSKFADRVIQNRLKIAAFDYSRTFHWHDPESVTTFDDIPYEDDGNRGHLLDVYMPTSALERGGNSMPVFIDIHGGGFTYGYKDLNRNFNTHLAALGFAVVSLSYRLAPAATLCDQLADIQTALRWLHDHIADYPVDPNRIFLTGDSAGAALAMLTLAISRSPEAAAAFHVDKPADIQFRGAALISGAFDLSEGRHSLRNELLPTVGPHFFDGINGDDSWNWLTPTGVTTNASIPPLYLVTSSDDFIQDQALCMATECARHNVEFQLDDVPAPKFSTLGHVFPVAMTWLPESQEILEQIRDFAHRHC